MAFFIHVLFLYGICLLLHAAMTIYTHTAHTLVATTTLKICRGKAFVSAVKVKKTKLFWEIKEIVTTLIKFKKIEMKIYILCSGNKDMTGV